MRRALQLIGLFLAGMAVLALGGVGFIMWVYPRVGPAPQIEIEADAAMVERGGYLAQSVTQCFVCHSERDWSRYGGPVVDGTRGQGGQRWDRAHDGVPGELYAANITPAELGEWTDGEIYRAVAVGVGRDGRALFPTMPYPHYQALCNDDRMAIIAYLRTIEAIENEVPVGHLDFPMSIIVRMIPHAASPPQCPEPDAPASERGEYLANVAACGSCHTPLRGGAPDFDNMFAGGREFSIEGGIVRSANITRDKKTGIGAWSEDEFVARFAAHRDTPPAFVEPGQANTVMPWQAYADMTDDDLRAIFAFLDTLETRNNAVQTFEARP